MEFTYQASQDSFGWFNTTPKFLENMQLFAIITSLMLTSPKYRGTSYGYTIL